MVDVLGTDHPDTLTCRAHLMMARGTDPTAAVDALAARLDTGHPAVVDLRAGTPVYRLLDPHDPF